MAGDPTDIGHACEPVLGMDIEDVLYSQGGSKEITSGCVDDTLWLASGSGGLDSRSEAVDE